MSFKRARSDEQIQDRIKEIVAVAAEIYNSVGYEGLNFSIISEHTKFTRPNLYKYFKTKDEILLLIMKDDFKSFSKTLINSFKVNRLYNLNEIAEVWTNSLVLHKRLLDIYSLLYTVVEKNVSIEALSVFKKGIFEQQDEVINLLSQLFPKASSENINNFYFLQITLAFGLYPACKLNDIQLKAHKLAGVSCNPPDFIKIYKSGLYQLMYCLDNAIDFKKDIISKKQKK